MSGRRGKQEVGMGDGKKCEGRERTPAALLLQKPSDDPKHQRGQVDFSDLSRRLMETVQAETSAEFTAWE